MSNAMLDVYGEALADFYHDEFSESLFLYTNNSDMETMPVDLFFREEEDFPEIELIALALCDGKVLDVGAGAGSHTLYLQQQKMEVTALELSPLACEVMRSRGVNKVVNENIFNYQQEKFDTLLFLMNGIGLVENIAGFVKLLDHAKKILNPGGQLLFDSSDILYFYSDAKEMPGHYYGEIQFQYEYKGRKGNPFGWLYIDQQELIRIGQQTGWVVQILDEDDHYQYLARMELKA